MGERPVVKPVQIGICIREKRWLHDQHTYVHAKPNFIQFEQEIFESTESQRTRRVLHLKTI